MTQRPARNGFTLVEVLLAFLILAVSLVALLHAGQLGARGLKRASTERQALFLAQSLMERVGGDLPLDPGTRRDERPPFAWEIKTEAADFEDGRYRINVEPIAVSVTVKWEDAGRARDLSLHSIRLREVPREVRR